MKQYVRDTESEMSFGEEDEDLESKICGLVLFCSKVISMDKFCLIFLID